MVTRREEEEVNRLENQVENGGGGVWEYLCLVHELKLRRSDMVLKHGLSILNDNKKRSALGPEEWTLYEQVAVAAMDCQSIDVAKDCIKVLQRKFPGSKRVGRLEAMLLEARGLWSEAENAYSSLLEENPFDQVVHKRRVAMAKAQGNTSAAVDWLNKYLDLFMSDHEAWRELAEIYVSLQMYKQAVFCYEELILSQPKVPLHHLAYADLHLSPREAHESSLPFDQFLSLSLSLPVVKFYGVKGGDPTDEPVRQLLDFENNHCFSLFPLVFLVFGALYTWWTRKSSDGKEILCIYHRLNWWQEYPSTLWHMFVLFYVSGLVVKKIIMCTSAIGQLTKGRNKEDKDSSELQSLSAMALEKDYKQRAPSKLSELSLTLRSLKI
ncbi:hypothetical protein RND71_000921 [Anisodus tanguticus]|uniref:ER membrane protein complex subunit 2 n=1 Tax=Anisodus tanguticus TaxID=243964 RepID=A0AAE1VXU3_9SOLA|nr:hypothetical protein RND71_000921 [Anisodus tanguticus]